MNFTSKPTLENIAGNLEANGSPDLAVFAREYAKELTDLRASLADAQADKARLDWLEMETFGGDVSLGHYQFAAPNKEKKWALVRGYIENYADTARQAIDAARQTKAP